MIRCDEECEVSVSSVVKKIMMMMTPASNRERDEERVRLFSFSSSAAHGPYNSQSQSFLPWTGESERR
jgi:hypothetical protein